MRHLKWLVKIRLVEQHKDFKIPQTRFERCGSFFERSLDQPCYFEFCSKIQFTIERFHDGILHDNFIFLRREFFHLKRKRTSDDDKGTYADRF